MICAVKAILYTKGDILQHFLHFLSDLDKKKGTGDIHKNVLRYSFVKIGRAKAILYEEP